MLGSSKVYLGCLLLLIAPIFLYAEELELKQDHDHQLPPSEAVTALHQTEPGPFDGPENSTYDQLLYTENSPEFEVVPQQEETIRVILAPLYRTILSAQVNTKVKKIYKRMGDSFHEGELLIQLDNQVFAALLRKAQGILDKSKAELEGRQELFQEDLISYFEFKQAQSNFLSAEYDVASADFLNSGCFIRGPYDGKVTNLLIEEGEFALEGRSLIEVIYDKVLVGRILLPSSLISKYPLGTALSIKVYETGEVIDGKVIKIDAAINPSSSLIKMEVAIPNPEGKLLAGMVGEVVADSEAKRQ